MKTLQDTAWRGKDIVVFAFGDYEYETKLYGLSGASGQHPCLHCHVKKKDMDIAGENRTARASERSLATLLTDHGKFMEDGSILSHAKLFNNVIRPIVLPIPVSHVAIPSLHLDLGIFPWLFNAFEVDLHCLDTKAAACSGASTSDSDSFQQLAALHTRLTEVDGELQNCSAKIQASEQQLQYLALFSGLGAPYQIAVQHIQEQVQGLVQERQQLSERQQALQAQVQGEAEGCRWAVQSQRGTCLAKIYTSNAKSTMVARSLVTTLILRCSPNAIRTIVEAPTKVIQQRFPTLLADAQEIELRYRRLFEGYAEARKLFSHCRKLSESEISELETAIRAFIRLCRSEIVARKLGHITPKLHLLEEHVVPFARRFGVGLGLLSEQGSESIHARFNALARSYHAIPNDLQRLTAFSQQHLVSVLSLNSMHYVLLLQPRNARKHERWVGAMLYGS